MLLKAIFLYAQKPLRFVISLAFLISLPFPSWGQFQSTIVPLSSTENLKTEKETEKGKDQKAPVKNKLYAWASTNTYTFKDGYFLSRLKGTQYSGTFGLDYKVMPDLKLGIYYIRRHVNSLTPLGSATLQPDTDNIYPYFMYDFSPNVFLNVVTGYSYISTKIKRFNFRNPTPIFSTPKGSLWAVYPSLNFAYVLCNKIQTSLQLGYGYEYAATEPYRESNNNSVPRTTLTRHYGFSFLDVSYFFTDVSSVLTSIAPYVQGGIDYNFYLTPITFTNGPIFNRDRQGYTAGSGFRFYFSNDVTLTAGWQRIWGHSGLTTNVYTLLLRLGAY